MFHQREGGDIEDARARDKERGRDARASSSGLPPGVDFGLSGLLAQEQNKCFDVVLKFTEPPEAHQPTDKWRLYAFDRGDEIAETYSLHEESCYLCGTSTEVADVLLTHPSCEEQHSVLQFRMVEKEGKDRMMVKSVRLYILDLESTHGTYINGERLKPGFYYEILHRDMVQFGEDGREYIFLNEADEPR